MNMYFFHRCQLVITSLAFVHPVPPFILPKADTENRMGITSPP